VIQIVAGEFRNRRLKTPTGDRTRPTAGRVRQAWFNILQGSIAGARTLDLFAGSGALGLEALSRGAASADFVEQHQAALTALRANIAALGVEERATVHRAEALRFVERLQPGQYDVAFADPPYAGDHAVRLAALFRQVPFARIFAVEHAADAPIPGDDSRRYGDTAITFIYAP
jgi:16S rRNA (guanine966-N2)-methyltransferase